MVLEICATEFRLPWGIHNISQPLATLIATCLYVCNCLHLIPADMKIGKSIVFVAENQKIRLKHSKRSGFISNVGHIRGKNSKKCLNWSMVVKLLQKKSTCYFDKALQ